MIFLESLVLYDKCVLESPQRRREQRMSFTRCVLLTVWVRRVVLTLSKDIHDAKNACDHLSGFNVCNRYLVVLYYNPTRAFKKLETEKKEAELAEIRKRMGIKK